MPLTEKIKGIVVTTLIISLLVSGCAFVLAQTYTLIRLYFIGTIQDATVVSCYHVKSIMRGQYIDYLSVDVAEFDKEFSANSSWACHDALNKSVSVITAEELAQGVVLPDGRSFFDIWRNSSLANQSATFSFGFVLILAFSWRLYIFAQCVREKIGRVRFAKSSTYSRKSWINKSLEASELVADIAFLITTVCLIGVLFIGICKAVLFIEDLGLLAIFIFSFFIVIIFFLPWPEYFIEFAWLVKKGDVPVAHLLKIARNLSGSIVLVLVSLQLVSFVSADFQDLKTWRDVGEALLSIFFG